MPLIFLSLRSIQKLSVLVLYKDTNLAHVYVTISFSAFYVL